MMRYPNKRLFTVLFIIDILISPKSFRHNTCFLQRFWDTFINTQTFLFAVHGLLDFNGTFDGVLEKHKR